MNYRICRGIFKYTHTHTEHIPCLPSIYAAQSQSKSSLLYVRGTTNVCRLQNTSPVTPHITSPSPVITGWVRTNRRRKKRKKKAESTEQGMAARSRRGSRGHDRHSTTSSCQRPLEGDDPGDTSRQQWQGVKDVARMSFPALKERQDIEGRAGVPDQSHGWGGWCILSQRCFSYSFLYRCLSFPNMAMNFSGGQVLHTPVNYEPWHYEWIFSW